MVVARKASTYLYLAEVFSCPMTVAVASSPPRMAQTAQDVSQQDVIHYVGHCVVYFEALAAVSSSFQKGITTGAPSPSLSAFVAFLRVTLVIRQCWSLWDLRIARTPDLDVEWESGHMRNVGYG